MPTTTVTNIPVVWEEPGGGNERKLVIWLPGFTDSKDSMQLYLRELAAAGYLALSFDPVDHGARSRLATGDALDPATGSFVDPATGKLYRHFWTIVAETAIEVPRLIDWASSELGVASAVGVGGISMGANIAVVATALDRRIVALATALPETDWLRPGSSIPLSAPNTSIQAHYDHYNPLTNLDHYQHCPAMLFQCGAEDPLIPADGAQRFVEALRPSYTSCPEKLEIRLEPGVGHEFTQTMWQTALRWFKKFL